MSWIKAKVIRERIGKWTKYFGGGVLTYDHSNVWSYDDG